MSLMALVIFSCAATADPCLPDRADIYAEPVPEAGCRALLGITLAAAWAAENPDRRVASWTCVAPADVRRAIDRVLGQEA